MAASSKAHRATVPVKFTDGLLRDLQPAAARYEVRDLGEPGLRIRVTPNGVKTFALFYRREDGCLVRYTIGKWGALTVKEARDQARIVKGQARRKDGKDPAAERKEKRAETQRRKRIASLRTFLHGDFKDFVTAEQRSGAETVQRIESAFSAFLDKPLPDVTRWALRKWAKERKEAGRSAYTIDRDLTALGTLYTYAISAGLVTESPVRKPADEKDSLRPRLDNNQPPRYLTPAEETRLRAALAARDQAMAAARGRANQWREQRRRPTMPALGTYADHITPAVLLVLNTGLRPGRELFELQWEHVNFHARTLSVPPEIAKTGAGRTLPLNTEALAVLRTWQKVTGRQSGLVFPNPQGRPFVDIGKAWDKLAAEAKLRDCPPYCLRHTFATRLVLAGVALPVVQKLMGHGDVRTTMRYVHVAASDLGDAVAKLGALA